MTDHSETRVQRAGRVAAGAAIGSIMVLQDVPIRDVVICCSVWAAAFVLAICALVGVDMMRGRA